MLAAPRLEERNRLERSRGVGKQQLQLLTGRRIDRVAGRRELPGGIARREVQLIQGYQHCLREVEGCVSRRRYRHDEMRAVESVVRKSLVLTPELNGHRSTLGKSYQICRRS